MIDLELLRTFLEITRTRHFGRAAKNLHVTQAAVSARIKLLEETLGVRIFDRARNDIRLTPEGTRLVRHADILIAEWRRARQDVSVAGARAQLSLGGSVRLWDALLQQWLHRVCRERPDIAIIAESDMPELLTQRLIDGAIDVAFMLEPPQLETLTMKKVATIQLVMVSTIPNIEAADALAEGYVSVDWGHAYALQHSRLYPDAPEPRIRLAQAKMAFAYLGEFGGTAYLPDRMVREHIVRHELHRVKGAMDIKRNAHAVYPVRSAKQGLINDVISLFEASIKV